MDSSAVKVPEVGLTVVHEPKSDPTLDVVFVHGFTGSPSKTWTHQRGQAVPCADDLDDTEPPLKARKLHPGVWSRTRPVETTAIFWPRDLLPSTIPGARVLTYGYDTHVRLKYAGRLGSDVTLYDIATDLLGSLEALRFKEPSRPILFVCHSFGGIVVKEMLRHARHTHEVSHPQAVYKSTLGIMFFGTPHLGADPLPLLLKAVEPVARLGLRVNDKIVSTLSPNSADLRRLRDEFNPIAEQQKWIVYSFQEADRSRLLGGNRVVESMSSCLGLSPSLETRLEIKRDHGGMCRFTHIGDTEYQKVTAALLEMTATITAQSKDMQRLSHDQREALLQSLQFSQIDSRLGSVKAAHAATCRWFLKRREYLDWLDSQKLADHHGFLWIKGKPGAGKSTLMKFALTSFRKKTRGSISFFFNARGAELEKTTTGMYRSLLLQLLEPRKELRCAFDNAGLEPWNATRDYTWSVESLKQVFEQVVHGLEQSDQVTCFIDALDECPESEVRDMVQFFEDLGTYAVANQISFRVLFSSRHYPHISISKGLSLVLEGQDGHSEDIKKYVAGRLRIRVKDDARSQIVSRIEEKASGVFMWVVLVVDMMNKSHDEGRPTAYIRKKLEELPSDLHQLFRDILLRDESHRDELQLSLQWILFARRPLTPNELYCAIFAGTDAQLLGQWDEADERVQRFILDSSKGLAETIETKSRTRTKPETEDAARTKTTANVMSVQFIHESVRDFLLKEGGLKTLWPDLGDNFEDQSHNTLKKCCLNYINIEDVKALHTEEGISDCAESVRARFPLLGYATQNVLYHADAAVASVPQGDFLGDFPPLPWVALHNLFGQFKSSQYSSDVPLAYILAENDVAPLLAAQLSMSGSSGLEGETRPFGTPLFAALATKSRKAALVILQTNAQAQNSFPELQDLSQRFAQSTASEKWPGKWDRKFRLRTEETRLWYQVLERGDDIIAAFLLTLERATRGRISDIDVEGNGVWRRPTPLGLAAKLGLVATAKILLDNGAAIEGKDERGRTALSLAAENGRRDMVKFLLDTGADVETEETYGHTPLSLAAGKGDEATVKLLLEADALIEAQDNTGRTPLTWAIGFGGNKATVKLLLKAGALIEATDNNGRTPLSWAAGKGDEATVKLLLEGGALIEARDNEGRTPLSHAGSEATIKDFLEAGALIEARDNNGRTPLSWAMYEGTVKGFLEAGALIDARDKNGQTPLSWAAGRGFNHVLKLLLKAGAFTEARDSNGRTPLSWAWNEGTVKLLLEAGALIEAQDNNGRTPLSWAAGGWNETRAKLLLEAGALIETEDKNGRTPLSWAAKRGYNMVGPRLEAGALVEARDNDGRTPLSWAAAFLGFSTSSLQKIQFLVENRAMVGTKDKNGETPLDWARKEGDNDEVVQYLESIMLRNG